MTAPAERTDPRPASAAVGDTGGEHPYRPRWPSWTAAVLGAGAAWAAAIWVAMHLMADATLHEVALFVHLAALVVGFGGVLGTDFQAAMWLFGRREVGQVIRYGAATHALIWGGLAGLVVSGMLLDPDFSKPLTQVKMALVLVVTVNGLAVLALQHRLGREADRPPRRLLVRGTVLALISQLAWWGATVIGFMNTDNGRAAANVHPAPATVGAPHTPTPTPTPAPTAYRTSAGAAGRHSGTAKPMGTTPRAGHGMRTRRPRPPMMGS